MKKLGLDYEALSAINSGLIYRSISDFGQTGPRRDKPSFDIVTEPGLRGLADEGVVA